MTLTKRHKLAAAIISVLFIICSGAAGFMWHDLHRHGDDVQTLPPQGKTEIVGVWTGASYAYLVFAQGVVLIDAGSDPQATAILAELTRRGYKAADVQAVLLTHGHIDHWAGANAFAQASVYVGRDDVLLARAAALPRALLARWLDRAHGKSPAPTQLKTVLPGAILKVAGVNFAAVALPGHTPGSMAYQLGTTVFAGDSVKLTTTGLRVWWRGFSDDSSANTHALSRLQQDTAWTGLADGHWGYVADGRIRLDTYLN